MATSLVGSESGVLEGVDASQEATLEDLTSEPNNPWIVVTNMGCHGAQTKIVPIEAARDVDSQPSLPPLPRLCPKCLPYGRQKELVLKISPRHDFREILECSMNCMYNKDTGRY